MRLVSTPADTFANKEFVVGLTGEEIVWLGLLSWMGEVDVLAKASPYQGLNEARTGSLYYHLVEVFGEDFELAFNGARGRVGA